MIKKSKCKHKTLSRRRRTNTKINTNDILGLAGITLATAIGVQAIRDIGR